MCFPDTDECFNHIQELWETDISGTGNLIIPSPWVPAFSLASWNKATWPHISSHKNISFLIFVTSCELSLEKQINIFSFSKFVSSLHIVRYKCCLLHVLFWKKMSHLEIANCMTSAKLPKCKAETIIFFTKWQKHLLNYV